MLCYKHKKKYLTKYGTVTVYGLHFEFGIMNQVQNSIYFVALLSCSEGIVYVQPTHNILIFKKDCGCFKPY